MYRPDQSLMDFSSHSISVACPAHVVRPRRQRGFTIIEVALAAFVSAVALVALFETFAKSYQLTAKTRARDQVRAVLQSFGDRFLRQPVPHPPSATDHFFQTCAGLAAPGTGDGLTWRSGATVINGTASGITIPLGGDAGVVNLVVNRQVWELDEDTGQINSSTVDTNAGRMILATFTADYDINRQHQKITLTVARTDDYQ